MHVIQVCESRLPLLSDELLGTEAQSPPQHCSPFAVCSCPHTPQVRIKTVTSHCATIPVRFPYPRGQLHRRKYQTFLPKHLLQEGKEAVF